MKFIDEVQIQVSSGHGGPGCVSFRREAKVPRGGPDGGDGGRGGHVIFRVNEQKHSLLDLRFKKHYRAPNGEAGKGGLATGKSGDDLIIEVPQGTLIKDESGQVLCDLKDKNQEYICAYGGKGGKGNAFYKSSVNQAPQVAQKGLPGETKNLTLELKLLADVGLVGFPNAGKSTLISRISAARPKIADYPFTTLTPQLGVVSVDEQRNFVVADIPGIIEGASQGAGLGLKFLRHIERTKVFVHVIDAYPPEGALSPLEAYRALNLELKSYDQSHLKDGRSFLQNRQQVVVLNKVDLLSDEQVQELKSVFLGEEGVDVLPISAVAGTNIQYLIFKLGEIIFGKN